MELYINNKKTEFDYKYKVNEIKEIKVKFIFKINLTNMSYMFRNCLSLISIDLSSFNTNNVTNMSSMFHNCTSLNSIDLSSFNTNNVYDMRNMFYNCSSLNSLDLSSFNINNFTNINSMFCNCYSLTSIVPFNNNNAHYYIEDVFRKCSSLFQKNINLK